MDEEERPFKAEYAKSGRAGCKLCKGAITKDTLRLAKLVQSAFFDGRQANWYHFGCFYKVAVVRSPNEVSGFSSLRWEDQERIRKKITGASGGKESTDGPAPPAKKGKRKIARSDLKVEYAKSNRSTCKGCNSQISKDEIRIAKMIEAEPDQKKFAGLIPSWHHVDCFLDNLNSLDAEGVAPDELSGFMKLDQEGKDELKEKFVSKVGPPKKGKKRKGAAQETTPPAKKPKEESEDEKKIKEQSKLMWKYRDELKNHLSKSELQELLVANDQKVPKGEASILDRLADGMTFGALSPCSTCGGQLLIRSHCYQCTGNMSAWSKCNYTTTDPARKEWVVPEEMKGDIPFLKNYKFKHRTRVFLKECSPSQSQDLTDGPGPSSSASLGGGASKSKVQAPLKGFKVYLIGRLSQTKPVLTQQIESLGGRVVSSVSENTTICISNEKELEKMSKKMEEVKGCDVPVVSEDYLEVASKGGALLNIPGSTISDWGAPRHALPAEEEDFFGGKSFKSKGPSKVKLTVKGASAVDPESELDDTHHVLEEGKTIWNAVLGMVDIVRGTNSYYKLQLLEGDKSRSYHVFRSWGRVGTTIGSTKTESFGASVMAAKNSFMSLYGEKTGNEWGDTDFKKRPGKFYPLEIDYGQEDSDVARLSTSAGSTSKLTPEIQDLIRIIFDVESMKKAMLEFEIDMKKMPLGKLSRRQMQNAYSVLSELQKEISGGKNPSKILDASNRFYTLIPHDFGMRKPPPLDSEEIIKVKTMMVDSLLEIEVAYSLLKQEGGAGAKDPLDVHYEQLKTNMEVLSKDSEEFKRLVSYVANTHGATHTQYQLEVMEVFKISRHVEEKKYKKFSHLNNKQLLWHGSRTTNFCGILSQGLRIAPPEAPVTGYMFGKGIYFADMVTKSANYCRTSKSDNIGLMLLCEVALGDMYELPHSEYVEKLPTGKHSTKGIGRTAPSPKGTYTTEEGVVIPMGKGTQTAVTHTSLLYNEFIVYDVSQIKMQYLLKMNFKYKW